VAMLVPQWLGTTAVTSVVVIPNPRSDGLDRYWFRDWIRWGRLVSQRTINRWSMAFGCFAVTDAVALPLHCFLPRLNNIAPLLRLDHSNGTSSTPTTPADVGVQLLQSQVPIVLHKILDRGLSRDRSLILLQFTRGNGNQVAEEEEAGVED
jgi:hypothetical protein